MGTDADTNHSPRDGPDSPQSRRSNSSTATAASGRNLTSHWANVVRGCGVEREVGPTSASPSVAEIPLPMSSSESDQSLMKPPSLPENAAGEASGEGSDNAVNGSANAPWATKKPAWNKPSNGVIEVGLVMGSAWPALSESARASPKYSDLLKAPSDGSVPVSTTPGPVAASSPKKLNVNNANPNLPPNHVFPARHKPAKHRGSIGPANNGGFMPLLVESPHAQGALDKPAAMVAVADSSPRDHAPNKINNWETGPRPRFIPRPPIGTDHSRNTFRRGNGGARGSGNGNYHNNYGNWRDQDRANYEWNDVHMRQQRVVPRNFIRPPPPPTPAPYVTPPIRPFGSPMGFSDLLPPPYYIPVLPPESLRGAPFVAHAGPPPTFFSSPDAQLRTKLIIQIDYYFSSENLCKDPFLRSNMDEHGWVPVSLIASFNRVKQLTNNIHFILDAVRMSTAVEVQGDKIRKRNDWMNWILPPADQSAALSSPQSPALSTYNMLATGMQNVGLEEWTAHNIMKGSMNPHPEEVLTRSSSGESNNQSLVAIATGTSTGDER